jgi:hypothetical protein
VWDRDYPTPASKRGFKTPEKRIKSFFSKGPCVILRA